MGESVLLGTKPLVDSIRHFIRDPSGVFSVCHRVISSIYFTVKVEWYPLYGPKSLFKFGEKKTNCVLSGALVLLHS